jgi:hypothetical protein
MRQLVLALLTPTSWPWKTLLDRKEIYQMKDTEYITCGDCNGSGCSRCNYKGGFEVCSTPPGNTTTLVWVTCPSCQCAGCKDCNNKGGWYKTLCDTGGQVKNEPHLLPLPQEMLID